MVPGLQLLHLVVLADIAQHSRDLRQPFVRERRDRGRRDAAAERHHRAALLPGPDLEPLREPARTADPEPHAGGRPVAAVEHLGQVRNARPFVGNAHQAGGLASTVHQQRGPPAAGVLERVARDLRNAGRDTGLVLRIEAEQPRELAGALVDQHDVLLAPDVGPEQQALGHAAGDVLATTTVLSSRGRAWSR